ncbi:hypothetical protein ACFWNE_13325 [Streptomyces goshikiensis]|uniref:hypothetical protein n=1 Tax=Streptomyces goshikiensis TaxID=1942 RepID=UPI003659006D
MREEAGPGGVLQLESILATADGPDREVENIDGVFARLAKESAGIQDIDVITDRLPVADR